MTTFTNGGGNYSHALETDRWVEQGSDNEFTDFALAVEEDEQMPALFWEHEGRLLFGSEPIQDAIHYATEAEFYDVGGLLSSPCMPVSELADLEARVPTVAMEPAVAVEMRALVKRRAA